MVGVRAGARCFLVLAGTGAIAAPAHAGAWSLAQSVQNWFATLSRETGDFGEAWPADDYVEPGLGDGWTGVKVESEIRVGSTLDDRSGFRFGISKSFALGDRAAFAIQASALGGEAMDGPECLGGGYDARAALGTSFSVFGREGFVNVEAARRERGQCGRNLAEIATGIEFLPDWSLTAKAWSEQGRDARSANVELGLSRNFGMLSVGDGWREESWGISRKRAGSSPSPRGSARWMRPIVPPRATPASAQSGVC